MKAISDTLIHFLGRAHKNDHVKQLEIFKDIIEKGLKTSTIDIVFSSGGTIWGKGVCFTDMPLNFCDEQTAVYGKFGIGFKKSFVKRLGGNPARYFVNHPASFDNPNIDCRGVFLWHLDQLVQLTLAIKSDLELDINNKKRKLFKKKRKLFKKNVTTEQLENCYMMLVYILGHEKPTGDLGSARNDTTEEDVYYKEREWRLIPSNIAINSFKESIKEVDKEKDTYKICFNREDVRVIIVPSIDIKKEVVKFLQNREPFKDDLPAILIYDELKYF